MDTAGLRGGSEKVVTALTQPALPVGDESWCLYRYTSSAERLCVKQRRRLAAEEEERGSISPLLLSSMLWPPTPKYINIYRHTYLNTYIQTNMCIYIYYNIFIYI